MLRSQSMLFSVIAELKMRIFIASGVLVSLQRSGLAIV